MSKCGHSGMSQLRQIARLCGNKAKPLLPFAADGHAINDAAAECDPVDKLIRGACCRKFAAASCAPCRLTIEVPWQDPHVGSSEQAKGHRGCLGSGHGAGCCGVWRIMRRAYCS